MPSTTWATATSMARASPRANCSTSATMKFGRLPQISAFQEARRLFAGLRSAAITSQVRAIAEASAPIPLQRSQTVSVKRCALCLAIASWVPCSIPVRSNQSFAASAYLDAALRRQAISVIPIRTRSSGKLLRRRFCRIRSFSCDSSISCKSCGVSRSRQRVSHSDQAVRETGIIPHGSGSGFTYCRGSMDRRTGREGGSVSKMRSKLGFVHGNRHPGCQLFESGLRRGVDC